MKVSLKILIFSLGIILAAIFLVVELLYGCPIKNIFSFSCPGCGLTRASISALSGDFASAFYFHPMFFLPYLSLIIGFIYYLKRKKPAGRICLLLLFLFLLAFIGVYVVRAFILKTI